MVAEFAPYVSAILSRSYLNIGALFFSLLYKSMFTILYQMKEEEYVKMVFGPFWFLQLWVQQYFPEFLIEATLTRTIQLALYGDYYMRFPFLSLSTYEIANTLIKMRVQIFTQLCPY